MKIVITGAVGHIGSRLIRDLPSLFPDCAIEMIDHLASQRYPSLFDLPKEARYHFYEADICDMDLNRVIAGSDVVIHLAAITDATHSFDNPELVNKVNFIGTQKVARACIQNKVPLIFPSTTSVYGTQEARINEDCSPDELKPQSPYAESKLRAEAFLHEAARRKELRMVICRLGTIFGASPGMRFHTAVNKFCWQAVMGQPLTVWRTALKQNRPYLALDDAVRAIEFIISKDIFDGNVYNVVTLNTSVERIIDTIKHYIQDIRIEYVDTAIMNQLSYHVENKKFTSFGFEFLGSLEHGIGKTIALLQQARSLHVTGKGE